MFGVIQGPDLGWTAPLVLAGFAAAGTGGFAFVWWEQYHPTPMVDLGWFRDRSLATGTASVSVAFFAAIALFFTLTQYLQFVLGYSALHAGLVQLPVAIAMVVVSNLADQASDRFGHRRVIAGGLATVALAAGYLATVATTTTTYWLLVPGLLAVGTGLALSTAPSTGLIMSSTPQNQASVGSAINDTTREIGAALGVAVLGSVLASVYRSGLPTAELSPDQAEAARSSIGAALEIARSNPSLEALLVAARDSFTDGFRLALLVGASIALAAAIAVARFGPRTSGDDDWMPMPADG